MQFSIIQFTAECSGSTLASALMTKRPKVKESYTVIFDYIIFAFKQAKLIITCIMCGIYILHLYHLVQEEL